MKKEVWLPVIGYETEYLVSNIGRVKSLPKNKCYFGYWKVRPEKIMTLNSLNTSGYRHLSLRGINGVKKMKVIHRIVAEAFIPNPENKAEVNHIDTNKLNNNVSNLEWVTRAEHEKHTNLYCEMNKPYGEKHWKRKLSEEDVISMRNKYKTGKYSYADLGREYNIDRHHSANIVKGRFWKHLTTTTLQYDRKN